MLAMLRTLDATIRNCGPKWERTVTAHLPAARVRARPHPRGRRRAAPHALRRERRLTIPQSLLLRADQVIEW